MYGVQESQSGGVDGSSGGVRAATEADLPEIVRIYIQAYAQAPWNEQNEPEKTTSYVRWLISPPHIRTLVAPAQPSGQSGDQTSDQSGNQPGELAGFVISSPRPYEHFVADWDHMADKPAEGWPKVEGALGYIWELAVDPDRQRHGLGSALMSATLAGLRKDGVEKVILRSSERADAAMALYKKFGFTRLPVRERVDPLAGPWLLDLTSSSR